jgi:hypothetical protein
MRDLPDVQQAVRQVNGVASAKVRWPDPLGPASLRVEFEPGVDHRDVGEAIIRTLVDVANVDLATMHLERGDLLAGLPRPVFTALELDRVDDDLSVVVEVTVDGKATPGRADGPLARRCELRLVAEATIDSLHALDAGPYVLDNIEPVTLSSGAETVVAVVVAGEERRPLVGAAMVGRDVREAAVRAVLDAVNRILPVHRP